jgi:hypothetical protein
MDKYKVCFSSRDKKSSSQEPHLGAAKAYALSVLNQQNKNPHAEQ